MANREDLFYKPDINAPEREKEPDSDDVINARIKYADDIGVPEEDIPDPFDSMIQRFDDLEQKGVELRARAIFLLDKNIEDLDSYVGGFSSIVKKYIEELTGIVFPEFDEITRTEKDKSKDIDTEKDRDTYTDSSYTLPEKVMKCIFRIAGY